MFGRSVSTDVSRRNIGSLHAHSIEEIIIQVEGVKTTKKENLDLCLNQLNPNSSECPNMLVKGTNIKFCRSKEGCPCG